MPESKVLLNRLIMGRLEKVFGLMAFSASVMLTTMCVKGEEILGVQPPPDSQTEEPEPPVKVRDTLYVTGVEYPDGYDWYQDSEYGEVRCFIFLEKEGKKILRVPVGYEYETASDVDMHRCFDGHLYTDFSSDTETVVKKDGKEIFRYSGREMIVSFYVSEGNVYTLGVSRSGDSGLSLRINGQKEAFYETGYLISGFHEGKGGVSFAFACESSDSVSGCEYFFYSGGRVEKFAGEPDVLRVLDARMYEGELYYIAEYQSISGTEYYCFCGGKPFMLDIRGGDYVEYARLMLSESSVNVALVCRDSSKGTRQYTVCGSNGFRYGFDGGVIPWFSMISGSSIYDVVNTSGSAFPEMVLCLDGERKYSFGRNRSIIASESAAVVRGRLYFAFSGSVWPRRPYMSVDGKYEDGGFNGYYSSVSVW